MRDSVVCVTVRDAETAYLCATGFYIDEVGTVLTAAHVVDPDDIEVLDIEVSSSTVRGRPYVVKHFLDSIYAAVLVPQRGAIQSAPARIGTGYALGERVMAMGYPGNTLAEDILMVMEGVVGGKTVWGDGTTGVPYIIMDLLSNYGASGGPVFTADGAVIGFVDFGGVDDPYSYAVDITGWSFE